MTIRVGFLLRPDASRKPGGDVVQLQAYAHNLDPTCFSSKVASTTDELAAFRPDLVHIANLDTPRTTSTAAEWCIERGIPYVLSTIHHPWTAVERYYERCEWDRFNLCARRLGLPARTAIELRELAATIRSPAHRASRRPKAERRADMQQRLVREAAHLLFLAEGERVSTAAAFGTLPPSSVVANGVPWSGDGGHAVKTRSEGVIAVGRIEPRKNQIALARIADELGMRVTFVGPVNWTHTRFARAFLEAVEASQHASYVTALRQSELRSVLTRHRLLVSTSWFEVVSLVEIEADSLGLAVLPSAGGYTPEYLAAKCVYEPGEELDDPGQLVGKIAAAIDSRASGGRHQPSWAEVTRQVEDVYQRVVDER